MVELNTSLFDKITQCRGACFMHHGKEYPPGSFGVGCWIVMLEVVADM